jgi:hypothetical protein
MGARVGIVAGYPGVFQGNPHPQQGYGFSQLRVAGFGIHAAVVELYQSWEEID